MQPLICQMLSIIIRQLDEICMDDEHHDYMALPSVDSTNEKRDSNGRDKE